MRGIRHVVGLLTAVAVMVCAAPAWAADSFNPAVVNVTLGPGESTDVSKTLHLDALPGRADIIIAIDTTASMCDGIAQAKADATNIVNQVQAAIPGARFALIDFKDYGDYPPNGYHIVVPLTPSAAVFQAGVNALSCGGGGDAPEAYAAVYHASTSDPALTLTYDPTAPKFLVVLGDAAPHDANLHASFPACNDTPPTDPVGPTINQLNAMNAAGIKLLMIHYTHTGTSTTLACMQQQAAVTGGNAVEQGGDLASQIIASIRAASAHITSVNLVVSAGCPLGITFSPPPPYGPFTAPVDISFTETITAPTIPGVYDCTVTAIVDGTARAVELVHATVHAGAPAHLTLSPPTATNTAGQQHCVTATVTDSFDNPVPGVTVNFSVSGANTATGAGLTDANGQATFCYIGTHAGTDTITATAVGGSNPSDRASKTWKPGEARTLTLSPKTATNVVDSQHCVTATVTDAFGNPVPGVPVTFTVSGSSSASGTVATGADGTAKFCYTGPALPGADVITATAQSGSHPSDTATKTWVLPANTEGCKVTGGGRFTAADGDKATFGGNAMGSGPAGQEEYQDHGSAMDLNVHSSSVLSVSCSADGTSASIFGTATVNGGGSYMFRIDVRDLGEPGVNDRYRIRLSNGYDSGDQQLAGGNIQIH